MLRNTVTSETNGKMIYVTGVFSLFKSKYDQISSLVQYTNINNQSYNQSFIKSIDQSNH